MDYSDKFTLNAVYIDGSGSVPLKFVDSGTVPHVGWALLTVGPLVPSITPFPLPFVLGLPLLQEQLCILDPRLGRLASVRQRVSEASVLAVVSWRVAIFHFRVPVSDGLGWVLRNGMSGPAIHLILTDGLSRTTDCSE